MYWVRKELEPVKNLNQNVFLCSVTWYYGLLFLNCSSCPFLLISTDMFVKVISLKGNWWFSFPNCCIGVRGVGQFDFHVGLAITMMGNHCNCLQTVV